MSGIIRWGNHSLDLSTRTYIMGILNITPDSFSDGGRYNQIENAIERTREMIENGADIIDVGGESTRPGYEPVSVEEELDRVLPVIRALASRFDVPISIDTYKAETAKQAVAAGAGIINDIWGAKADPDMASAAALCDVPIILMHNRDNKEYTDLMEDMKKDISESVNICKKAGVKEEYIILDPGIGFAKTYEQNLEAMRRMREFTDLGYPVLLGSSRKSLIAKTLNLPSAERVEGTAATVSLGIERGCSIVRVHDVLEMKRTALMMDAMLRNERMSEDG
ncbi:dihydropteroate synthase [Sinobaca sp. H24]|uniref:dihydropteroate synthase n=1 Tax=Sinobaca sp. H24 TaxID=2923376 RepID=UPI002079E499|nr:dihydropteroate synthase [Sinobaca sp. H24]